MKKIYAFLLVVILLFSALASVAYAVQPKESPKPVICLGVDGGGSGIPGGEPKAPWQRYCRPQH